jgi:hypothetical protein
VAVDATGHAYVTGLTSSVDFPVTRGAFDTKPNGYDAFVTKLNASGSAFVYSTYLGGPGYDIGNDIAVDRFGAAYVTGTGMHSMFDAFVVKLRPGGRTVAYAGRLGGSRDDEGLAIAVGPARRAYVTGTTRSLNFPTTPNAFDRTHNGPVLNFGDEDLFLSVIGTFGQRLVYSTYIGGSGRDFVRGLELDGADALIAGWSVADDYPTTPGAFDSTGAGAFVTRFAFGH